MTDPKIIDLFAGPGGLDVAARWLGVPAAGIEWDPNAHHTRRAAGLGTTFGDVRLFGPDTFPDATVLCGGPPCQTFTVAGSGSGRRALDEVRELARRLVGERTLPAETLADLEDERTGLVLEPLRWILKAKDTDEDEVRTYRAIVLEQVPAVRPLWDTMQELLEAEGYVVDVDVLRAEQYGVPQTRRRAILIARLREDVDEVRLPAQTHQAYRRGVPRDPADPDLAPWKSMGDALGRQDFYVRSNYGTGGDPQARGQRKWDEPAATVTGKIGRNHVIGNGRIERFRPADAGRLQTFPEDFPWRGKDIGQQIGNAIPPLLAAHVLDAVLGLGTPPETFDEFVTRRWGPAADVPVPADDLPAVPDLDALRSTDDPLSVA